ncbi:hypothetical protein [Streptomyces sp. NPDC004726]
MISIGLLVPIAGLALLCNFRNVATRILEFFGDFMPVETATAGTFRGVGGMAILVGAFWIVTSVTEL